MPDVYVKFYETIVPKIDEVKSVSFTTTSIT